MNRPTLAFLFCAMLAGCVSFEPLQFPPPVALRDPSPEFAIVYLLRVPHDPTTIDVSLNDVTVARLPAETYTAVSLRPGTYTIATTDLQRGSTSSAEDKTVLTVSSNERRFLYTSVPTTSMERPGNSASFGVAAVGRRGAILTQASLYSPAKIGLGQRAWQECNELDAQGLMSIGRVVPPSHESP